jgi:hypothetical protein
LTEPQKLTESELARELGVSRQGVHDLVKRGILTKDTTGKLDRAETLAALTNKVRPSGKTAANLPTASVETTQTTATQTPTDPAKPPNPEQPATEITSYHVAKTLREAAEAQIARHKLAILRGEIIPLDQATRAALLVSRAVRDALQSSRRRLSPALAAANSVQECEELLRKDHINLLSNLASSLATVAPGIDTSEATQP